MLPDLQHLIQLQALDDASEEARRELAQLPERHAALDAQLAEAEAALAAAKERLDAAQGARRTLERELAEVQARLSKYKDQLMQVKTNKEYQAMLHEIATAEGDVRTREDRVLERMEEAENGAALVKEEEARVKALQAETAAARRGLDVRGAELDGTLRRLAGERDALRAKIGDEALRLFDHLAKQRRGIAIVEARDGHCSFCHVRLRPQVFNEIRRNDQLHQCDSCLRLLYYQPRSEQAASS